MVETHAPPVSTAEDEANSAFSRDEGGWSGDETHNSPMSNKRKRVKYQKTS